MELWLEVNGQKVKVHAEVLQNQLWVHHSGRTFVVDTGPTGKRGSTRSGGTSSADTVKAPMPGKITKIFVAPKDSVQKGQALIVMEAMKMEYTLKAEADGLVVAVETQVGDQVPLGKTLIKLDPKK